MPPLPSANPGLWLRRVHKRKNRTLKIKKLQKTTKYIYIYFFIEEKEKYRFIFIYERYQIIDIKDTKYNSYIMHQIQKIKY